MKLVIAGDVVNSQQHNSSAYIPVIEESLKRHALENRFVIYKGDSFQAVMTAPAQALECILEIKTGIKRTKGLDVRVGIGLGSIHLVDDNISKSTGTAFSRSDSVLDNLKTLNQTIMVSGDHPLDSYFNLGLKMALLFMDNWSANSANILHELLKNPNHTQEELGNILGIQQAAASRRLDRAHWTETRALLTLFERYYKDVSHGTIY
jgi:hypothetical protein